MTKPTIEIDEMALAGPLEDDQTVSLTTCPIHGLHVRVVKMRALMSLDNGLLSGQVELVPISERQQGYDSGGFLFDPDHLSPNAKARVP